MGCSGGKINMADVSMKGLFAGEVREYAIFRADFKHAIESHYPKRDSTTFLRTCLQRKPLNLIKWIGSIMKPGITWILLMAT